MEAHQQARSARTEEHGSTLDCHSRNHWPRSVPERLPVLVPPLAQGAEQAVRVPEQRSRGENFVSLLQKCPPVPLLYLEQQRLCWQERSKQGDLW